MEEITVQEESNLYLNKEAQMFLKETAKWAYFLSIIGFIGLSFLILIALFIGTIFSKFGEMGGDAVMIGRMGGGLFGFIYLIIAALYFFPIYYLFQFSSKMKTALKNNDNDKLNESFGFLKSHYKFIGILTLVFVVIYGVIFLFSLLIGFFTLFK